MLGWSRRLLGWPGALAFRGQLGGRGPTVRQPHGDVVARPGQPLGEFARCDVTHDCMRIWRSAKDTDAATLLEPAADLSRPLDFGHRRLWGVDMATPTTEEIPPGGAGGGRRTIEDICICLWGASPVMAAIVQAYSGNPTRPPSVP